MIRNSATRTGDLVRMRVRTNEWSPSRPGLYCIRLGVIHASPKRSIETNTHPLRKGERVVFPSKIPPCPERIVGSTMTLCPVTLEMPRASPCPIAKMPPPMSPPPRPPARALPTNPSTMWGPDPSCRRIPMPRPR